MSLFPIFVKLDGRRCLVVGAGTVAEAKIESLLATAASIHVVAPKATAKVREWSREGRIEWNAREYVPEDLSGVFLVIAATGSPALHDKICAEARRSGVLCNAVDEPQRCDFYFPAVVRRGELQIAISTGGLSPALAQRLRKELEQQFGPEWEQWVAQLGRTREELLGIPMPSEQRKRLLHQYASLDPEARYRSHVGGVASRMPGKVYLVGAGPGDPELLTRKAWRVLQSAGIVLHDDLVSEEILRVLPPTAVLLNVGKRCGAKKISQAEVNEQMVSLARAGKVVARLKSGDPLLFGRAGEEMEALRQAGIEFEVIPGVTAALGAAAAARISLTDRRHASRVVFVTAHRSDGSGLTNERHVAEDTTYVIYMPGNRYAELAAELEAAGIGAHIPCVVISRATTRDETIYRTTVGKLPQCPAAAAPSLLVVGYVAGVPAGEETREGELSSELCPEIVSLAMQHPFHNSYGRDSVE